MVNSPVRRGAKAWPLFCVIWRRLRHSPAPWPVRIGTNLGYRFYANNLSRFYNCDWIIGRAPAGVRLPAPDEEPSVPVAS